MQLLSMEVNHLGTGDRLQVGTLSPGLNAVCGRRGTGKTSLLRWLRGMIQPAAHHPNALPHSAQNSADDSAMRWDDGAGRLSLLLGDLEYQIDRADHAGNTVNKVLRRASSVWGGQAQPAGQVLNPESIARQQTDAFDLLTAIPSDQVACDRLWDLARKLNLDKRTKSLFADERLRLVTREQELVAELMPLDALSTTRETLLARRRQLENDLERVRRDSLARQYTPATDEHRRLADRLSAIDRDAQKLREEIAEVEAAMVAAHQDGASSDLAISSGMLERSSQEQSYRQRLLALDAQLARWRNTLVEIRSHRERLESAATDAQLSGQLGEQFSPINQAAPRQALRALEAQIIDARRHFDRLLEGVDRYRGDDDAARNELPQTLRLMQRELHEVCQQLSRHESLTSNRANREQILQLTRCESEMRLAIERLIAERGELLRTIATACHLSVDQVTVAYSDSCRCADHPPLDAWLTAISAETFPSAAHDAQVRFSLPQAHADALARLETRRAAAVLRLDDCHRDKREIENRLQRLGAAPVAMPLSDQAEAELLRELDSVADDLLRLETRDRLRGELVDLRRRLQLLPADLEDKNSLRGRYLRHVAGLTGRAVDANQNRHNGHFNGQHNAQQLSGYAADRQHDARLSRLHEVGLRLAIVQCLAADGITIPLALDQTLDQLDGPHRLTAVRYLSGICAAESIQVIALTDDLDVAEAVKSARGNVVPIVVSRAVTPPQPSAQRAPTAESDVNRQLLAYANDFEADKWGHSVVAAASSARQHAQRRFVLQEQSEIEDVPSVSPLVAARLRALGVDRVADLLDSDHHWIAENARLEGVSAESVLAWQSEARLLCAMPQLRPFDARVLAGAGVRDDRQLAQMHPSRLLDRVERFLATERGRQIMRSGSSYELSRITAWIASAKRSHDQQSELAGRTPAFGVDPSPVRQRTSRGSIQRDHAAHAAPPTYHIVERDDDDQMPSSRSTNGADLVDTAHVERRRPRGDRPERTARGERQRRSQKPAANASGEKPNAARLQFHLELSSPVVDAPSIGAAMASQLEKVGIVTVDDLLATSADVVAADVGIGRVTSAVVRSWQDQARLVCCVPNLRGHDAHILVACGITSPEALSQAEPQRLSAKAAVFAKSPQGQRVLRGSQAPDLAEVSNWIKWSAQSRSAA